MRPLPKELAAVAFAVAVPVFTAVAAGHLSSVVFTQPAADDRVITYYVSNGEPNSGFRAGDEQLAVWAFQAWEKSADGAFRVEAAREGDALVKLYWVPPNGSTYGETRAIRVNGRRGALVAVRPDVDSLGADVSSRAEADGLWRDAIVYLTCLHEIGHALNLKHTDDFKDIMYSFQYGGDVVEYFSRYRRELKVRDDIRSKSGLSDSDVLALRLLHPPQ